MKNSFGIHRQVELNLTKNVLSFFLESQLYSNDRNSFSKQGTVPRALRVNSKQCLGH